MLRRLFALLTLCVFTLTSCVEHDQKILINPDGSGKVTVTTSLKVPFTAGGAEESKLMARELAVSLMRSKGIEAWSEVSFKSDSDGKVTAAVTGLFPDVTKLSLSNVMEEDEDHGKPEFTTVKKDENGNWIFEEEIDKEDAKEEGDKSSLKPRTDEEAKAELEEARQKWSFMQAMMEEMIGGLKVSGTVEAGEIQSLRVYQKSADSKATMEVSGKQILETMAKQLADDEKALKLLKEGKDPVGMENMEGAQLQEMLFGTKENPRLVIKPPAQPFFDYKAEVEKAKANESPEIKEMIAEAAKPPKKGGGLEEMLKGIVPGAEGLGGDADDEAPKGKSGKSSRPKPQRID